MTRDPVTARKALLTHPLIGQDELVGHAAREPARGGDRCRREEPDDERADRPRGRRRELEDRSRARAGRRVAARARPRTALLAPSSRARGIGGAAPAARSPRRWPPPARTAGRLVPSPRCSSPAWTSRPRRSCFARSSMLKRFAGHVVVGNDTLALLRAGTERGWGVAVVCGAGINCVGVGPDGPQRPVPGARRDHRRLGRRLRRRFRGAVRRRAQRGRARAEDEPRAGGAASLRARLAASSRRGDARAADLAPPADRARARRVRGRPATTRPRLPSSSASLPRSSRSRASRSPASASTGSPARSSSAAGCSARATSASRRRSSPGSREVGDGIAVHTTDAPPVVGAALLGLDWLGADDGAKERARRELIAAADADDDLEPTRPVGMEARRG